MTSLQKGRLLVNIGNIWIACFFIRCRKGHQNQAMLTFAASVISISSKSIQPWLSLSIFSCALLAKYSSIDSQAKLYYYYSHKNMDNRPTL